MSDDGFKKPGSGAITGNDDLVGHLAIWEPYDVKKDIQTALGTTNALVVKVTDLDDEDGPNVIEEFLAFGALSRALKDAMGSSVLARLGQGAKRPGKNAPWILLDATESAADVDRARAYLGAVHDPRTAAPTPTTPTTQAEQASGMLTNLSAEGKAKLKAFGLA